MKNMSEIIWKRHHGASSSFTTGSQMVITVFEIKQQKRFRVYCLNANFNSFYNSDVKSISVICGYQDLKGAFGDSLCFVWRQDSNVESKSYKYGTRRCFLPVAFINMLRQEVQKASGMEYILIWNWARTSEASSKRKSEVIIRYTGTLRVLAHSILTSEHNPAMHVCIFQHREILCLQRKMWENNGPAREWY